MRVRSAAEYKRPIASWAESHNLGRPFASRSSSPYTYLTMRSAFVCILVCVLCKTTYDTRTIMVLLQDVQVYLVTDDSFTGSHQPKTDHLGTW